jgi:hypothetical protein
MHSQNFTPSGNYSIPYFTQEKIETINIDVFIFKKNVDISSLTFGLYMLTFVEQIFSYYKIQESIRVDLFVLLCSAYKLQILEKEHDLNLGRCM